MYDLIIIGSGPCGYEAAFHAAKLDKKVLLIEENKIGGTCLNVGCIPTKTLLRSAHAFKDCQRAKIFGVNFKEPVTDISIDMSKVQERKQGIIQLLAKGIISQLKSLKVEVITGKATIPSPQQVEVNGTIYDGQEILIATGSEPFMSLSFVDKQNPHIMDSNQVLELTSLPSSVVIIGGGVIGLEFSAFFASLGISVSVVEMAPQIAANLDTDIAKRLMTALKKENVKFHLSSRVNKIVEDQVTFINAQEKEETIQGDLILVAVGRKPVIRDLNLDRLGVVYTNKGICVDNKGQTNIPHIWAAGDVTGRCLLAHAATHEGILAVNNMFGINGFISMPNIPSVIYTHPEVACVGLTEQEIKKQGIPYQAVSVPMGVAGRFAIEYSNESGIIKILFDEKKEILGIHMVGGGCGEFICAATLILEQKMSLQQVENVVFPHPTISEALKTAILRLK